MQPLIKLPQQKKNYLFYHRSLKHIPLKYYRSKTEKLAPGKKCMYNVAALHFFTCKFPII